MQENTPPQIFLTDADGLESFTFGARSLGV